jgi:TolB protein
MISRGLGSYIYLSLSPDETKIAFVKVFGGKFYLGVMKSNGSGEILLKDGYIIDTGTTRKNNNHNDCIVWRTVEEGMML